MKRNPHSVKTLCFSTKPIEENTIDLGSVVKLVQKLSNGMVDLTKNYGHGLSGNKYFQPLFKKKDNAPKPP